MSDQGAQADTLDRAHIDHAAPVGAVLVIGGGIAGMQASLDLADQGYKVHLVEKKSAIGGHMAQLDKTFPTNDCAMCTISPKLVDTGRHLNIDLHVDTEVTKVEGEPGDFTVTLRHKPRYIDPIKCVGCGDCVDVCPVILPDSFDEGLADRRAAHKLYPQGVPNAFAITKLGVSPCRNACPSGQRAQGYIALIGDGRYEDALRAIKEDNPFPAICGRICNHRCEDACNRGLIDEPVNIRALKRFVTDKVYEEPRAPVEPAEIIHDKKVAIIGAGPCGLTVAQDLARLGYPVSVFEALPIAGGMLRVGVPEYRLPTEIIEREIADILDLGIDLQLNKTVEDLDAIFDAGFEAVLIAVGAHEGIRLPIPGADLDGVLLNTHFLRDVRLDNPPPLGERVLVLGGGNVAIDCARTAVRMGAEVHIACLEPREDLPCHAWEADAAEEEGITIHADRTFLRIMDDGNGRVTGVECAVVTHFEFDTEGRLSVEVEPGSEHVIPADTVIFSVGQRAGLSFLPDDASVGVTSQRTIDINPLTMATTRPGVFAAGDSVSGTTFVIEAVASGHRAAASIHRYLQGEELEPVPKPKQPVVEFTRTELLERVHAGEIELAERMPLPELSLEQRMNSFAEVEGGYNGELAKAEAARCLACALCSECLSCQYVCGRDAINHDDVETTEQINVGAVILAPGYQIYNAELSQEYGLGRYPNVITALQLERLLSASGPTEGHVNRPSDGAPAKKIAFLQCVGSRDQNHDYCSSVCCMYATKEAIMAKEHDSETEVHVFMMDMRAFSKGYEGYYQRARMQYGVEYTRCRISEFKENPESKNLVLRYMRDQANGHQGTQAPGHLGSIELGTKVPERPGAPAPERLSSEVFHYPLSQIAEEEFDLVVLSVGMEISESVQQLGRALGVELDEYGFCHTTLFNPLETSRSGVYAAGPFREPKDIPESVIDASGAAARAAGLLAPARHTLTQAPEYPPERDVTGEEPRIGIFVCHCGSNIGGFLDVPSVAEYAKTLPGVVHAEDNLYTCSQDSVAHITEMIGELNLNRVVVASCTPHTHAPLFQDSLRAAGLNPALFDMANIRNQCSWVHSHDRAAATQKAYELVRMAIGRVSTLEPIHTSEVEIEHSALIVGGGVAGMSAALILAEGGFDVYLVERQSQLGGNMRHVHYTIEGENPHQFLESLLQRVHANPRIDLHLGHEVVRTDGFMGKFTTTLRNGNGHETQVTHGVTIIATGGQEYRGSEFCYTESPRVVTGLEFEALIARSEGNSRELVGKAAEAWHALGEELPDEVAMILCVGPAERYCARLCCTTALKNALTLKHLKPEARVSVLYKDIRTYGFKEQLYTEARRAGVLFIRYDDDHKPDVGTNDDGLEIKVHDHTLDQSITLRPDLLLLSTPVVPAESARDLASKFKVSLDKDGFFLEAHIKLRPVDFSSDGYFMAGMAHYPKFVDETIVQAQAAASRAARVLSQSTLTAGGVVASVDPTKCVGCLTCVRVCPYGVPQVVPEYSGVGEILGAAYIEPTVCHGCGNCASECPAKAISIAHQKDDQIMIKLDALLSEEALSQTAWERAKSS
ncbi:MAG: FAD-dependent oxidoreductase [Anaerolineales bacterium]|nr:FAD-dependent oxidoreductase [Anaerolineales bacterium]